MKWDLDSPVLFRADGHTVHDFDRRFEQEDKGNLSPNDYKFRWEWVDNPPPRQMDLFGNSEIWRE